MPEAQAERGTASARRRSQRGAISQGATLQKSSLHDPSTVQDRIRRWQVHDAAEAVDPDVLSVRSMPRSDRSRTPVASHPPVRTPDEPQTSPRRRSTKWVQQENTAWVKQRRSVRGDSHGSPGTRKDTQRSPVSSQRIERHTPSPIKPTSREPPTGTTPGEETPPVEYTRNESLRTRNVNSSRAERDLRRKRRRDARASANNGRSLVEDGIRVYARSESHPASEIPDQETTRAESPRTPDDDLAPRGIDLAEEQPIERSHLSTSELGDKEEANLQVEEDKEQWQPSRYAQTLGRAPEPLESIEQPKTRKNAILSKTRDILIGKSDPRPLPSNRIPSIEAWLDEQPYMPDPFVEQPSGSASQPREVTKAPRHRSHKKKISIEPTIIEVEDPNKIWDSVAPVSQHEARRSSKKEGKSTFELVGATTGPKRRLFSFEVCDEPAKGEECGAPPIQVDDTQPESPVSLKRRGAKTVRHAKTPQPQTHSATTEKTEQVSNSAQLHHRDDYPSPPVPSINRPLPQLPKEDLHPTIPDADNDTVRLDRSPSRGLKRKLTTHEDLLSVLSQPRARKSTRSTRSVQRGETNSANDTVRDAMTVMRKDELQYVRELRTLVDGVTPVLLQSLLSKSDITATAGFLTDKKDPGTDFTRPIIQMGGVLQRLKSLHSRIPLQEQNIDGLLSWAVTAHKSYSDYVKAWRLGFQGVIVNLAPLNESQHTIEEMLSRDVDGDVTDEQGQKVDVAFLQKRPLIRIKNLSKFFVALRDALPGHEKASSVADSYIDLMEKAKQRHSEEQGRLEDEAAANTDVTRARDMKTMGVAEAISIDRQRKVRARDYFDMSLQHSSGQRIDCKIEIILRDDPDTVGNGGDILICQVEESSRWLLFAPVGLANVSARRDQAPCELVLMVKGVAGIGRGWDELLALRADDPEAVTEWLNMLGSNPLPSRLNCIPSWQQTPEQQPLPPGQPSTIQPPKSVPTPLTLAALASIQSDVDVPIGEPSVILTRRQKGESHSNVKHGQPLLERPPPKLSLGGGLQRKDLPDHYAQNSNLNVHSTAPPRASEQTVRPSTPKRVIGNFQRPEPEREDPPVVRDTTLQDAVIAPPRYSPQKIVFNPSSYSGSTSVSQTSYFSESEVRPRSGHGVQDETHKLMQEITNAERSWSNEPFMSGALGPEKPDQAHKVDKHRLSQVQQERTSANTKDFAHRPREHSRTTSLSSTPLSETIREQWQTISGFKKKNQTTLNTPEKRPTVHDPVVETAPVARPTSRQHSPPVSRPQSRQYTSPEPTTAMNERSPAPRHQQSTYTISSSPRNSMISLPDSIRQELPYYPEVASPLKKEYQPSSSASSADSDDDETDATSDISDDFRSEIKDQATPLVDISYGNRRASGVPPTQHTATPTTGTRTLDPSDSASQGPYRRPPPSSSYPAEKKRRTIAMVCSWSDRGIWQPIQDDECSIVVSPGLVQAFPMSSAHSQPIEGAEWEDSQQQSFSGQMPLVEFELTPVVPLRKGTALDITIRSPPTANSQVTTTNNVMFRSRTVQECEMLYQYINWARCHNPVFAQLTRDRPRQDPVTFAANVTPSKSRSWFSFGSREKSSYRAPSRPPASMADTATSGSSSTSAFSALKKFGKNSPFSLKRSSVVVRPGMGTSGSSLYSASNGTGPSSGTSTPAPSQAGYIPGPDGPNVPQTSAEAANGGGMVNNMKIRLFVRQGQKWEALGPSLLTVLPAALPRQTSQPNSPGPPTPTNTTTTPASRISRAPSSMPQANRTSTSYRLPSSGSTPHRIHGDGREKRILITAAKHKDHILLDEVLGESCFEKVMQTGIAVNVWREEQEVLSYGGVMTGRSKTYMIQFRTSTEASWVFNMCGTYRYGNAAVS